MESLDAKTVAGSSGEAPHSGATPWWLWPNLLSLDAPLVAVVWQAAFTATMEQAWNPLHAGVLFLAVWLVYTGDRWLDAWRLPELTTPRHRFAARYRRALFVAMALVFPLATWLACQTLSAANIRTGLALTVLVIAYLAIVHFFPRVRVSKEGLIAALFAIGVALFPLEVMLEHPVRGAMLFPVIGGAVLLFAWLAWLNCLAIELWEQGMPHEEGLRLGRQASTLIIAIVGVLLGLTAWYETLLAIPLYGGLLLGAMGLVALLRVAEMPVSARCVGADISLLAPLLFLFW